jgi:hypothetical protein
MYFNYISESEELEIIITTSMEGIVILYLSLSSHAFQYNQLNSKILFEKFVDIFGNYYQDFCEIFCMLFLILMKID